MPDGGNTFPNSIPGNGSVKGNNNGRVGIEAPSGTGWNASTVNTPTTQTVTRASRFVSQADFTATRIRFIVATASASDIPCQVGIYDDQFNLIASSDQVSGMLMTTGVTEIPIAPVALKAGKVYYAAFSSLPDANIATLAGANFLNGQTQLLFGSGSDSELRYYQASTLAYPLPAFLPSTSTATTTVVLAVLP